MASRASAFAPFTTTVVGSMPKPLWLLKRDPRSVAVHDHGSEVEWAFDGAMLKGAQDDATRVMLQTQEQAGIDLVSDGEQRREYYITYVTRGFDGLDYKNLAEKKIRSGRVGHVARCTAPVKRARPILELDVRFLAAESPLPFKITLPGPMTVADSTVDEYYGSDKDYVFAIAEALNEEARALDALGVAVIQFDEPVYSRQPDRAVELGIPALDRAAQGLKNAKAAVHVCYGYPHKGIKRERHESYPTIVAALEKSSIDILSLEFEVSKMDPKVLRLCPSKAVMFGCIDVGHDEAAGRIETPEHVCGKLLAAAEHLPPEQILAAPDCGLVKLDVPTARAKLQAMAAGARLARASLK
jgi:5-methyltetrahydropteroyltriglutamate--homocysteine methyltransferase